jgi:uncharacterized alkaline shock family protein YloU
MTAGASRPEPARPAAAGEPTEADQISAAVLACPDVAGMSAGAFGEIRSYLPGHTVPGVKLGEEAVEVHVVARYGPPLPEVASQIGRALAPLLSGRAVRVVVEDILLPGDQDTGG